jgi:hypothetical protein
VKQKCADSSKPGLYSLTQLGNMQLQKGRHGIIPFFCWDFYPERTSSGKEASQKLIMSKYDLQFCLHRVPEARTRAGRVSFSCGFNRQRLRKDMVEKFVHAYLNLIDIMIEKMECGGLLR